jgi:SPOR domain
MRSTTRLLGIGCLLIASSAATAATEADAARVRADHDNCVYFSVADQLKNRSVHDLSMVTENGFRACRSEEAVLRAFMQKELFLSPEFIETSILKIRLSIKRHMREIADNPHIVDGRTAVPAARPENGGEGGGYLVQVSSRRNEADALASYRALQDKFPSVLGSRTPLINRADLGEHGVFYRAVVGPFATPDEATQFCANLKSAGGQCVVQRN